MKINLKKKFPTFILKSFKPSLFKKTSFPTYIKDVGELWRYYDTNQEFRAQNIVEKKLKNNLSLDEINMIKNIGEKIADTYEEFNQSTTVIGLNQMLSSLSTIRYLKANKKKHNLNVLEIGGGSGMLGHMCKYLEIGYTNFDVTQAYAILNIALNRFYYQKDFNDFENNEDDNENFILNKQKKINFMPWWVFCNTDYLLPDYDYVIMNHCFFEINNFALRFILSRVTKNKKDTKLIIDGWGSRKFINMSKLETIELEKDFNFQFINSNINYELLSHTTNLISISSNLNNEKMNEDYYYNFFENKKKSKTKTKSFFERFFKIEPKPNLIGIDYSKTDDFKNSQGFSSKKVLNGSDEIKKLINYFEKKYNKKFMTSNEAVGYFINSVNHGE